MIIGKLIPAGTGLQTYHSSARELVPDETDGAGEAFSAVENL